MTRTIAVVFSALAFSLVHHANAACLRGEPNRVATVIVTSCAATADVARERLGTVDLPWVVTHVNRTVERNRGVVIAGRVTRKVHVEQYGNHDFRLLDVVAADATDEWFVQGDNLSCEAFQPEAVVQIYATDKCCDVFPPSDVPCLLGLAQARPVGEALTRFLASAGLR